MNVKIVKHLRSIALSVCLESLALSLGAAQPVITTQPSDRFVNASATVTFYVSVSGTAPFTYQWLFNGNAKPDATNFAITVSDAHPSHSGDYCVIVANASGSVTSRVARLKVFVPALHRLSSIEVGPNRSVNLSFAGEAIALFAPYYDLYPLEGSTNLVDWAPLATLQRTNTALDVLRFSDMNAPLFNQCFYRTPTNGLLTHIPQPTGPYSVGTFSMLLTDPSRTNTVLHTNYQFMVTFWYPAVAQAQVLPALYLDEQLAVCGVYVIAGGSSWSNRLVNFFSHSLSNAPLATNQVKYPVVLYSPGWTGHRRDNTDKAEDLASWGYVVVGLDHRDTFLSVLPDGTLLHGQSKFTNTLTTTLAVSLIEDRLLDEQLVLDELESLNASDPQLGGRLDLDKIGAFGFSLGGATAAQLSLRDPRCKAGANFDGSYVETNLLSQTLSVPFLFFSEDGPLNDPWLVFNHMVTNAYWVKLTSTVHGSFSDWDLILDSASLQVGWGTPGSGQVLPPARVSQILRAYALSFFNKFLRGQDDHLLDGLSPNYPEVMQFLRR